MPVKPRRKTRRARGLGLGGLLRGSLPFWPGPLRLVKSSRVVPASKKLRYPCRRERLECGHVDLFPLRPARRRHCLVCGFNYWRAGSVLCNLMLAFLAPALTPIDGVGGLLHNVFRASDTTTGCGFDNFRPGIIPAKTSKS